MGYVKKACKLTEDQVRELRIDYNKIRLIKIQMKNVKRIIDRREAELTELRIEVRKMKKELTEKYDVRVTTLTCIGEGVTRKRVR